LTHPSFLDVLLRTDGAWASLVIVWDACLRVQDASRVCGVVCENRWLPIRINVSTRNLDGKRKYCSSERYYAMNSLLAIASVKVTFFYAEKRDVFVLLYFAATAR
ncbi:hypothetical protein TcG_13284, partial [Trypanosoma cruzi]